MCTCNNINTVNITNSSNVTSSGVSCASTDSFTYTIPSIPYIVCPHCYSCLYCGALRTGPFYNWPPTYTTCGTTTDEPIV